MDVDVDNGLFAGDRVGNYTIEVERGSSPLAAEYRGVHVVLPRRAIIKLLHAANDQSAAVLMLREACILDALQHPGIVRVYESGMHGKQPWFATELVEGPTLATVMAGAVERVDQGDAIAILRDVAEIIEHAFRRGVIHCGLRPERIVVTGRARGFPLCVVDWSDARAHDARLQQYFPTLEAWHYTSPELACGDPIDDRTDVFALGVIAYQLVTGQLPFDNGIIATVDDGTTQHVPTEIMSHETPPELCKLVDSMLAYDRWDRPSVAEVYAELAFLAETFASPLHTRARGSAANMRIRRPRWTPMHLKPRANTEPQLEPPTHQPDKK